jgi:hypothetical protein
MTPAMIAAMIALPADVLPRRLVMMLVLDPDPKARQCP